MTLNYGKTMEGIVDLENMVGILRNESCTLQKEKRPAASVVK